MAHRGRRLSCQDLQTDPGITGRKGGRKNGVMCKPRDKSPHFTVAAPWATERHFSPVGTVRIGRNPVAVSTGLQCSDNPYFPLWRYNHVF